MKYISPTQLFNEQLTLIGEAKANVVLSNFLDVEKMFKCSLRYINIQNLTMKVKVKNSSYFIKYTYDKTDSQLQAIKLIL